MTSIQSRQQTGAYSAATQHGSYRAQHTQQQQQQTAPVARASRPSDVFEGKYPDPQLARMEEVTVEIATDPLNFVCLLKKYFDQVDQVHNQLMKICSSKDYSIPSSKVRREMPCLAPYVDGEVEKYYRAKILNIERNEAEVVFVDYGNINVVPLSGLKYLPQSCAKVPVSYIKCEFNNVRPTDAGGWSEASLSAFEDYLADGEFVAAFLGKSGDGYKVELFPREPGSNSNNFLHNPVSTELERRGVLKKGEKMMSASSNRGRRTRSSRDEVSRQSTREDEYRGRGAPDEKDRCTHSRGRDVSDRTSSPSGSVANSELIRANFKPPTISKKGCTDVKVFQPNTPSKFSCQILTKREELEELTRKMSQVYDRGDDMDYLDDSDIIPYTACAVLLDLSWQRGYILSSSSHGCQVVMVDTQEVRSVDPDQLRVLREQFQRLPAQGVKCSLDAIQCKSNKWNSESCRYFKKLVTENESIAEFRTERGGSWRIMLHSNVNGADQLVNAIFVVKGWASSTDMAVREAVEDLNAAKANPSQMQHVDIGKSIIQKGDSMSPKVIVPMDFGRHLRESPSHNNLKLNTSDGGEVWASSLILSFNSPVIDHMTTTLHMTSVDMLEFSEAAVQWNLYTRELLKE